MKKLIILLICPIMMLFFCEKQEKDKSAVQEKIKPETIKQVNTEKDSITSTITDNPKQEISATYEPSQKKEKPAPKPKTKTQTDTINALWQKYRLARESSKEAFNISDFPEAIKKLKEAANYAEQLGRNDLASWQYNNIGYYSILEFKGITNYDFRLHQMRLIDDEKEKQIFHQESKEIFIHNIKLLNDAEIYLQKALKIDANYNEKNRTDKIKSNLKFIDWVKNFIKN